MKETLICSLEKHNIYYLSDANVSFYILVPYKEYDNTNISIRLKSNYDSYDLTSFLEVIPNNTRGSFQSLLLLYTNLYLSLHFCTVHTKI